MPAAVSADKDSQHFIMTINTGSNTEHIRERETIVAMYTTE